MVWKNETDWDALSREWEEEEARKAPPPEAIIRDAGGRSAEAAAVWRATRCSRTLKHIAFKVDDWLASGRVPMVILMSPSCYRMMDYEVCRVRSTPAGRNKKIILGMRMVERVDLGMPFTIIDAEEAAWRGL